MLENIGAYEAKTKLPEILRRVRAGEVFTITHHGKPVADIVPSRLSRVAKTEIAINNILDAKRYKVSDNLFNELKENGRK